MLLESLHIDCYRARRHIAIGPLHPRLNAVLVPPSFQQSEIVDFVRGVMLGSADWPERSAGRIVWADTRGPVTCRREPDATVDGVLRIDRLCRDGHAVRLESLTSSDSIHQELSRELFETVIAPTGHSHDVARRTLAMARAAGFDCEDRERLHPTAVRLHQRLAELEAAIQSAGEPTVDVADLCRRRDQLKAWIASTPPGASTDCAETMQQRELGFYRALSGMLGSDNVTGTETGASSDTTLRRVWQDELEGIQQHLKQVERHRERLAEAAQIRQQLCGTLPTSARRGSLLRSADAWLSRLSCSRLQNVDFVLEDYATAVDRYRSNASGGDPALSVSSIDHDWSLAALAIRLATAEALCASGRTVPLLVAVDGPLDRYGSTHLRQNPVAETLCRFASQGHQLIAVTNHRRLADQIAVAGGYVAALPDRPHVATPQEESFCEHNFSDIERRAERPLFSRNLDLVNRDLDTAWREAYQLFDSVHFHANGTARDRESQAAAVCHLNDESAIEQAPSIDAVAATRLRGISIPTVGALLAADPERVAHRLGLVDVTEREVRRWQAEARLVCTVPRLRPFDARILVGCGIRDADRLATIHPEHLLDRVEVFLGTDRGQHILRSGTSYELARVTNWIVAASRAARRRPRNPLDRASDSDRRRAAGLSEEGRQRYATRHGRWQPHDAAAAAPGSTLGAKAELDAVETPQSFYLDRNSAVVDAPAIGPKMAALLEEIGVVTVDDLLNTDPQQIADQLEHPRVSAKTVVRWQRQATLVCRIPGLRGHDAGLLVAAGITSPEALLDCPEEVVTRSIDAVARSSAGRRILRGAQRPDPDEIRQWICSAGRARTLVAA